MAVPGWSPQFHISEQVSLAGESWSILSKLHTGYETPDIVYQDLGASVIAGNSFCIKSEKLGVIQDTFYLIKHMRWEEVLEASATVSRVDEDGPVLVIGNVAPENYYHWTLQCLASLLVYRRMAGSEDFLTVMPRLNRWQKQTLEIAGFDGRKLEIDAAQIIVARNVFRSNLTGGQFAFSPHRATLAELEAMGSAVTTERQFGRRIYASRLDAGTTRRLLNEEAVCTLMESLGFEVITPGRLSVAEQIVAFRDAEVIVAPHGAGMTNLVYVPNNGRTRVIELFQAGYVNACYARICQAKNLDYSALVSVDAIVAGADGQPLPIRNVNDMASMVDLDLLRSVISKL